MADEVVRPLPRAIEVRQASSVSEARRAAKAVAAALGFAQVAVEEIALAATELATNLIRHAGGGTVTFTPLSERAASGSRSNRVDQGPGIADVEQALADRYSTAAGRGTGLGAVNRLMDELDIASTPEVGTRIVCRKWRRDYKGSLSPCPLETGVATRPMQRASGNGDAFVVKQWGESLLVGVIDGLGHGPVASRAARAAQGYVESHFDLPLKADLSRCGARLPSDSRGGHGPGSLRLEERHLHLRLRGQRRSPGIPFFHAVQVSRSERHHRPQCAGSTGDGSSVAKRPHARAPFRRPCHPLGMERFPRPRRAPGSRHRAGAPPRAGEGGRRCHRGRGQRGLPMSAGDLKHQLALCQAQVRALQDELARTNQGLLMLTMELEQRVDERTNELRAANEELNRTNSEIMHLTFELEDRVAHGTEELHAATQSLGASRTAALNLMEDAVAAREQAEQNAANLRREATERRQAEEEVRRLNAELEKRVGERTAELAAANRELESFAYSVSHDLRAPLRGIDGWSHALLDDYRDKLDGTAQGYLRTVRSEAQRMAELIDAMLQLSRVTRGEMQKQLR